MDNQSPRASCYNCLWPLPDGPEIIDACPQHRGARRMGRCVNCGRIVCVECGQMIERKVLCPDCAGG